MAKRFFVKKKKEEKALTSGFWVPISIVVAGALIAGAVLIKDQLPATRKHGTPLRTRLQGDTETRKEEEAGQVAGERVDLFVGNSPMLGEATAAVTLVEFTDFQCPACRTFFDQHFPQIKAEFIDKGLINYALKHFPLSFHKNAARASEAAECARDQGKLWEYHDLLFEKQNEWAGEDDPSLAFVDYASALYLDTARFETCLGSGENKVRVNDDFEVGKSVGVSGTPTVFVNGLKAGREGYIPTFPEIRQLIEKELE